MSAEQFAFALAGAACVVGATVAVTHRDPRTAGTSLLVTLVGLAVLYGVLAAPAVAALVVLIALFTTVPIVVYLTVTAARVHAIEGPAVAGAAALIAAAVLVITIVAIELGEVPVNVSLRSRDGYDLVALRELVGGRFAGAAGAALLLLAASFAAVHAVRRNEPSKR